MRPLSIRRLQGAKSTARFFGQPTLRRFLSGQAKQTASHVDLSQLPSKTADPIQCLDASSEHFGKFWYLAGYDEIGDPNHPIGP